MRRAGSTLVVALGCLSLPACESFPQIRFIVREAQTAPVAEPGQTTPGAPDSGPARQAVPDAIILLPTDGFTGDPAELAVRLRDDARLTQKMRRPIGTDSDADGAFAMRTGPEGDATYTELRFRFWFVPPGTVERRFFVWADGFWPRTVTVQVGATGCQIDVPLERIR